MQTEKPQTVNSTMQEDTPTHEPSQAICDVGTAVGAAVAAMMSRANISVSGVNIVPGQSLDRCVREAIASWGLEIKHPEKWEIQVISAIQIGAMFYGHMDTSYQCLIALYSFLLILVDDLDTETRALDEFGTRLCTSTPQLHPVLDRVAEVLGSMQDYYLPYAAQSIIISTIQFLNATAFERRTQSMSLHSDATLFPEYKRIRSGVGEAFAFFAWDKFRFPDITAFVQVIPDMMLFLSYVNDIFSFYKEELAGETNNYVRDLCAVTGKSPSVVLFDIVDDVATFTGRARAMLQGDAGSVLEQFIQGFVYYHFVTPRYDVKRFLDVEAFVNAESRFV